MLSFLTRSTTTFLVQVRNNILFFYSTHLHVRSWNETKFDFHLLLKTANFLEYVLTNSSKRLSWSSNELTILIYTVDTYYKSFIPPNKDVGMYLSTKPFNFHPVSFHKIVWNINHKINKNSFKNEIPFAQLKSLCTLSLEVMIQNNGEKLVEWMDHTKQKIYNIKK